MLAGIAFPICGWKLTRSTVQAEFTKRIGENSKVSQHANTSSVSTERGTNSEGKCKWWLTKHSGGSKHIAHVPAKECGSKKDQAWWHYAPRVFWGFFSAKTFFLGLSLWLDRLHKGNIWGSTDQRHVSTAVFATALPKHLALQHLLETGPTMGWYS